MSSDNVIECLTLLAEKEQILRIEKHRLKYPLKSLQPKPPKPYIPYSDEKKESQRKTMTGRKWSDEMREKMKPVIERFDRTPKAIMTPKGEFESIGQAAKAFSINPSAVQHKLKGNKSGWYYLDRKSTLRPKPEPIERTRRVKALAPDGTIYRSFRAAAKAMNLTEHFFKRLINDPESGWSRIS